MSEPKLPGAPEGRPSADVDAGSLIGLLVPLAERWRSLLVLPLLAGLAALGATYLMPLSFTAQTVFLPPQQAQQTSATAALASLGALAGIAGGSGALRTPADQYVSIMQSVTVSDRLIDRFKLLAVYDKETKTEARRKLSELVVITTGKKDGLITVAVEDESPARAAEMANAYVEELRRMTATLAVTEAQQRRVFFEQQMRSTKDKLAQAQAALQTSGFNQSTLRAEPRAAAEQYARLRSEVTAAEVRLQMLRGGFADNAPEVVNQVSALSALRAQLARAEQAADTPDGAGYIEKYREFKYQETLFDLFARQYELARVDESKEGALIQVVDVATPPEKKSKPRRTLIAIGATAGVLVLMLITLLLRQAWRRTLADPHESAAAAQLRAAMLRR